MDDLTEKQKEVYNYIVSFFKEEDRLPRSREITDYFKFKSQTSGINYLNILVEKGYLDRRESDKRNWYRLAR